ncbi:class I SAM-dependent methyltransferase [Prochlorococcus sp. MIT 1300]|uniref:class I SAM-dependent methyltransferase n=1 Tax=Prochlorococcus sp. MIT 1300 TaxID=3096218 RepID=UPI002A7582C8|nr:methyltransferase domain-containing protein [Prochlorococcus sp. MIT 1300]
MTVVVLNENDRLKLDNSPDEDFYSQPRYVHHLDSGFRSRLTSLYSEVFEPTIDVLDLMSSWVSHLPQEHSCNEVIGHGLNKEELEANQDLNHFWVQNLNRDYEIPLESNSIDMVLIVAGWQYLQYPEPIAEELLRITRPGGKLIISFSNRAFWNKAPRIWTESSDEERIKCISSILEAQRWTVVRTIAENTQPLGLKQLWSSNGDPFFAVIARNNT